MSAHEDFSRKHEARGSSDRSFGILFAVVLAAVGILPLLHRGSPRWWSLALSLAFLNFALLAPSSLAPLNRAWTSLGLLLGRVMTPLMTGLLFYLLITPLGWAMRTVGKDPLRLRWDPAADSYWLPRTPPGPPPDSMQRQF